MKFEDAELRSELLFIRRNFQWREDVKQWGWTNI